MEKARAKFGKYKFIFVAGTRYLGGFLGSDEDRDKWVDKKVKDWVFGIKELAKVATRYPQAAYAGLASSLQLEWQYLQRVTPDVGLRFAPLESALAEIFLPALFGASVEEIAKMRNILALPVKFAGLGIPDPSNSAEVCYLASKSCTSELSVSILGGGALDVSAYGKSVKNERREIVKARKVAHGMKLKSTMAGRSLPFIQQCKRAQESGNWLTVKPNRFTGTKFSAVEFWDGLHLRFGITPAALPRYCDGCGCIFDVDHALVCKKGGLINRRHNDVKFEFGEMCAQALQPSYITDEPKIQTGQNTGVSVVDGITTPAAEERGDIGAHGFWTKGKTTIFDVRITHAECKSNIGRNHRKVLKSHEKAKKDKYAQKCAERRRDFTPLCFTADGCFGTETNAAVKRLATLLSAKWNRTYSEVCGYVRARLSLALVRSASMCLRGERTSYTARMTGPMDGAKLRLHQ